MRPIPTVKFSTMRREITVPSPVIPARAFANEEQGSGGPVKLTDAQLDVTAGRHDSLPILLTHVHHHLGPRQMRTNSQAGFAQQSAQPTTQVVFIFKDISFVFNIGPNSPVNLATVLQFSLLSQAAQNGSATALQSALASLGRTGG